MPGEYIVLDKMNKRWSRTIDVYMGDDVGAARQFGRRRGITIRWQDPLAEVSAKPPGDGDSVVAEAEAR